MLCFCSFNVVTIILSLLTFNGAAQLRCPKTTIKTTASPTKCVAGRRLYTNWSYFKIPGDETRVKAITPPSWLAIINTRFAGLKGLCSGVLINDRYVLTAQRCVLPPLEPHHINVILTNLEYPLSEVIHHPDFDELDQKTSHHDVALLKIKFPLHFTKKLLPIQLVAEEEHLVLPKPTLTFGFFKDNLVTIRGMLMHINICKNFNQYYNYSVIKDLLCTQIGNGEECFDLQGITGTALTVEAQKRIYRIDTLIGILTWWWPKHRPCAAQQNPFVFVDVQSKLSWIANKTSDAQFCRY